MKGKQFLLHIWHPSNQTSNQAYVGWKMDEGNQPWVTDDVMGENGGKQSWVREDVMEEE